MDNQHLSIHLKISQPVNTLGQNINLIQVNQNLSFVHQNKAEVPMAIHNKQNHNIKLEKPTPTIKNLDLVRPINTISKMLFLKKVARQISQK